MSYRYGDGFDIRHCHLLYSEHAASTTRHHHKPYGDCDAAHPFPWLEQNNLRCPQFDGMVSMMEGPDVFWAAQFDTRIVSMDALPDYMPNAYSTLPSFFQAQQQLKQNNDVLHQLGDVIVKYGLQDKVGVSLLHKHFPLQKDEKIVRKAHSTSVVAAAEKSNGPFIPSQWRLFPVGGRSVYAPIEFLDPGSFSKTAIEQSLSVERDHEFLTSFATVLKDRGAENIFGLSTLSVQVQLHADTTTQIIFEQPGSKFNTSTLSVQDLGSIHAGSNTGEGAPTPPQSALWVFKKIVVNSTSYTRMFPTYYCSCIKR